MLNIISRSFNNWSYFSYLYILFGNNCFIYDWSRSLNNILCFFICVIRNFKLYFLWGILCSLLNWLNLICSCNLIFYLSFDCLLWRNIIHLRWLINESLICNRNCCFLCFLLFGNYFLSRFYFNLWLSFL